MMRRAIRTCLALVVVAALAAPLSAQTPTPHAQKGQAVLVTLQNGLEIRGTVGAWLDGVGFYVKPSDSAAYLIHPSDILTMRDATTGTALDVPTRSQLSAAGKVLIGVAVTIGTILLLRHSLVFSGPIG
jgi:hypothetical protein